MSPKINPLDPLVQQLSQNRAYLEDHHRVVLAGLVGEWMQATEEYNEAREGKFSLSKQLQQQLKLLEKMQSAALAAEHIDISDQKAVMAAGKQLMDTIQKFRVEMERESREKILEQAIKDTFHELKDEALRVKFMNILRGKLTKNSVQTMQNKAA